MDNIWKNAAKKLRTRDLRNTTAKSTLTASVRAINTITSHQKPVTATTTPPHWCDPETVTLKQIDEHSRRLLRDWPKEDGIPFPREILETLRDIKLKVLARDAERSSNRDTASAICTPAPVQLTINSIKSDMPVPDLQDTTVNDLAFPNKAVTDLWRKVARKAAKMGYHQEHYGTTL